MSPNYLLRLRLEEALQDHPEKCCNTELDGRWIDEVDHHQCNRLGDLCIPAQRRVYQHLCIN